MQPDAPNLPRDAPPTACRFLRKRRRTRPAGHALVILAVLTALAACVQPDPRGLAAHPPISLEAYFDHAKWRWMTNLDGRRLLEHTQVAKCYVDPAPQQDFHDAGFRITREARSIAGTRYHVVNVFEGRDFWEAIYMRSPSSPPVLSVYARGECQDEAERILENYEKRVATRQDARSATPVARPPASPPSTTSRARS